LGGGGGQVKFGILPPYNTTHSWFVHAILALNSNSCIYTDHIKLFLNKIESQAKRGEKQIINET